jgi:hypothetical protein
LVQFVEIYTVTKADQNEALLWKIAVLGMEKPRCTKCSGTNRGLFHSQNCNFPEQSLIFHIFVLSYKVTDEKLCSVLQHF